MRFSLAGHALVFVACAAPAFGQSGPPAALFSDLSLSGYIDTYYDYNFNRPAAPCAVVDDVAVFNCLHAMDVAHAAFRLNLANLALEKRPTTTSRLGFRAAVRYGPGTALIAAVDGRESAASQYVQQAYVSYLVPTPGERRLQLDAGKFVTPAGVETIDPGPDWNASRSLLFALAIPREHLGVRATYSNNARLSVSGFLLDGWSDRTAGPAGMRIAGSITARPFDALTVTESYIAGPETSAGESGWRTVSDTVVRGRLDSRLHAALNYDAGNDRRTSQSWQGLAAYVRYEPTAWFAIGPRIEWLRDYDGFLTGVSQRLGELSATAEFKSARGFMLRLEYRLDDAGTQYFLRNSSETVMNQQVLAINWTYVFDARALRK